MFRALTSSMALIAGFHAPAVEVTLNSRARARTSSFTQHGMHGDGLNFRFELRLGEQSRIRGIQLLIVGARFV